MVRYSLWFLIIFTTAALAAVLIAFSRLTLRLEYKRQGSDDRLFIEAVAFWGLLRYGLTVPVIGVNLAVEDVPGLKIKVAEGEKPDDEEYVASFSVIYCLLRRLGAFYTRYRQAVLYLWRRLRVTRFEWHTMLGTGEPATTGAVCGLLWGLKGFMMGRLNPQLQDPGSISLIPDFKSPGFSTLIKLAGSIQLRHLFTSGYYFLRCLKRT